MHNGGMNKPDDRSWRYHHNDQIAHALINQVAVADIDATCGAYVGAENISFNKSNNNNQDPNSKNIHENYNNYKCGQYLFVARACIVGPA